MIARKNVRQNVRSQKECQTECEEIYNQCQAVYQKPLSARCCLSQASYKQLRGGGGDEADIKSNNNARPPVHNEGDVKVAVLICHGGDRTN